MDRAARTNRAIIEACAGGHEQVVALLCADPRVDPSAQEDLALVRASEGRYV